MKKTNLAVVFTSVLLLSGTASACVFEFGFSGKDCASTCASAAGAAAAAAMAGQPEIIPFTTFGCLGAGNPNS